MLIVRLAAEKDIPAIVTFTKLSRGKLNSLPMDEAVITHKIERSCESIAHQVDVPRNELYFFVMEDTTTEQIIGCCAIDACVGVNAPFYAYRLTQTKQVSHELNYGHTLRLLELNTDLDGATELCSLYLLPEYREKDNGKLLSYARLLFLTAFPKRCASRIFADIRGYCGKNDQPPFWQHVIRQFIPLRFAEADRLTGLEQRQFIADLMPKWPLYIDLLPSAAQVVIGRPHPTAEPAKMMLENQGLHYHDYVNIFDAGPTVATFTNNVKIINQARVLKITSIEKKLNKSQYPSHSAQSYLLATNQRDFRVLFEQAIVEGSNLHITSAAAKNLKVETGDKLVVVLV